jgi:hypothetical protein
MHKGTLRKVVVENGSGLIDQMGYAGWRDKGRWKPGRKGCHGTVNVIV